MRRMTNTNESSIVWDDVIKKETRGAADDSDFGEVQEIGQHYVLTQKGLVNKEKFHIPKYLVQGYNGHTLWFDASEDALDSFSMDTAPTDQYSHYLTSEISQDIETHIPMIEERLNISEGGDG